MKSNSNSALWGSISILIGIIIAILAVARGPWQTWLLLGVFTLWGIWVVAFLLRPYMQQAKRRRIRQQQLKARQSEGIAPATYHMSEMQETSQEPVEQLLLRHVNHRISIYLRSAYPDVTWEWTEKQPEKLAVHGGIGRIRVFGVADFDHADVTVDRQANISCAMVKIVPLSMIGGEPATGSKEPPNKQPLDPQIWYEAHGRSVLETVMADLNSRGHSSLTLHDDGDICILQGKDEVSEEHLSNFPEKIYWPRLVQVFERNGLAAEITAKGIQVSW